jgi:hypothetical protein
VYRSRLLCERTQRRRAYLAFNAAAICVDAKAVFLYVFFVVSRPRFLSGRINVSGWALSLWRREEARNLLLPVEVFSPHARYVVVDLLPGAGVSASLVCDCRLCCVCLKS